MENVTFKEKSRIVQQFLQKFLIWVTDNWNWGKDNWIRGTSKRSLANFF
jgi:hypothetical protein